MTNYQTTLKKVSKLRDKFLAAQVEHKPMAYVEYCEQVIKMADDGHIDHREASYAIADLMFDNAVSSTPELESIALQAGNLELPKKIVSGDPDVEWVKLKQWIEEARTKYTK